MSVHAWALKDSPASTGRDEEAAGVGATLGRSHFPTVMYQVLDHPDVTRQGKDAYVCIVRALGWLEDGHDVPATRENLARVMSISMDTLDRGIKNLEQTGFLTVTRERDPATGNWKTSRYALKDHGFVKVGSGRAALPPPSREEIPPHKRPGTVYFVAREGLIKIGFSVDFEKRLKSLSSGSSMAPGMTVGPVDVLATEPGNPEHERRLHRRFDRTRIQGTEWFRPTAELRSYINGLKENDGSVRTHHYAPAGKAV